MVCLLKKGWLRAGNVIVFYIPREGEKKPSGCLTQQELFVIYGNQPLLPSSSHFSQLPGRKPLLINHKQPGRIKRVLQLF